MADEGFLSRWSRLKADARQAPPHADSAKSAAEHTVRASAAAPQAPVGPAAPSPAAPAAPVSLPTLEDAMRLGPDSDYSAFVARGVDPSVRRHALRKLFADPHFNVVDGLDVYMGDYTRADPMPPSMLASLRQAHAWLQPRLEADEARGAPPGSLPDQDRGRDQDQDSNHHHHHHHEATAPQGATAREHDEH